MVASNTMNNFWSLSLRSSHSMNTNLALENDEILNLSSNQFKRLAVTIKLMTNDQNQSEEWRVVKWVQNIKDLLTKLIHQKLENETKTNPNWKIYWFLPPHLKPHFSWIIGDKTLELIFIILENNQELNQIKEHSQELEKTLQLKNQEQKDIEREFKLCRGKREICTFEIFEQLGVSFQPLYGEFTMTGGSCKKILRFGKDPWIAFFSIDLKLAKRSLIT